MTIEQVRNANNAQPFCPFVIHLSDGRQIAVHHPEFLPAAPVGELLWFTNPTKCGMSSISYSSRTWSSNRSPALPASGAKPDDRRGFRGRTIDE